jgi:hypothetical protein
VRAQHRELLLDLSVEHAEVVPDVGVARDQLEQHLLAAAADQ